MISWQRISYLFLNSFACERCFGKKIIFFHDHCPMNGKADLSLSRNMFLTNDDLVDYEIPQTSLHRRVPGVV